MYYIVFSSGGNVMYRSYRFRLYPIINQRELIQKAFGCTRLVYNHYLEKVKTLYKEGKGALP